MNHLLDEELIGTSHSKSCGQWLNVQVESSDKWCLQGSVLAPSLLVTWTEDSSAPSASLLMTPSSVWCGSHAGGKGCQRDFDRIEQ